MKITPRIPGNIHPLRKFSLLLLFSLVGFALLKENLQGPLIEEYGELIQWSMIGIAGVIFVLLIVVKRLEAKLEKMIDSSDVARAKQREELEKINFQESQSN